MKFVNTVDKITADMLEGFFVGWPSPPTKETHLLLKKSQKIVLAIDENNDKVVGFITAISDNVLSAYIPFLEVLRSYPHRGIGYRKQLVSLMMEELTDIYMTDLYCDDEIVAFYKNLGMNHTNGMVIRNYKISLGSSCSFITKNP